MLRLSLKAMALISLSLCLCTGFVGCGDTPAGPGDPTDVPEGGDPAAEGGIEEGGAEEAPPGTE